VNIVDWVLLSVVSLFALRGYFKGVFRESLSLAGFLIGFVVAVRYNEIVAAHAASYWQASPLLLKAAAFVALFFLVYFLLNLVGWLLHRSEKVFFLHAVNRFGGVVVGLGKGVALAALGIFFFASSPLVPSATRQKLDRSYLVPPLSRLAEGLIHIGKATLFPKNYAATEAQQGTAIS
jgi:membrane protein required for colicin V production